MRFVDNPYSLLSTFTYHEAAAALHGVRRIHPDDLPNLRSTIQQLQRDFPPVAIKEMGYFDGLQVVGFKETEIPRDALLDWCKAKGLKPSLLFADSSPGDQPLHSNERTTLLAIIRALAELHGIKPGAGAYRKEAVVLLKALASKGIAEPCSERSMAKHLSASFKAR